MRTSSAATLDAAAAGSAAVTPGACAGAPATKMASIPNFGAKPCGIVTTESGARALAGAAHRPRAGGGRARRKVSLLAPTQDPVVFMLRRDKHRLAAGHRARIRHNQQLVGS